MFGYNDRSIALKPTACEGKPLAFEDDKAR
jgi:hypothetical protein